MDTLRGVVERITYHNEENGYTVAKLVPERRPRHLPHWQTEVAIVGNMAGITVGESVELHGDWTIHPEYGKQFSVERMRSVLPATVAGIEKYLGSGLIKGVGPVTAKRIVKYFGEDTLSVIDNTPSRLLDVPGVGQKRVQMITSAWAEQQAIKEVMIFLQSHGVSTGLATKIYKQYGEVAIQVVQQDPYRLVQDIYGVGFVTADKIARALGLASDSPERVAAGVEFTLNQSVNEGHVFLPSAELIRQAAELLEVSETAVAHGILRLRHSDRVKLAAEPGAEASSPRWAVTQIVDSAMPLEAMADTRKAYRAAEPEQVEALLADEPLVYLTPFYYSEVGVTNRLRQLLETAASRLAVFLHWNWRHSFDSLEQETGFTLAEQQKNAVRTALTHRLTILTGGPGTGKTTTVRTVLQLCLQAGKQILLAAPTGRAAKRLAETTGHEARTIHRLLAFQPGEGMAFKRNAQNPLVGDLLIVDEASMLDVVLLNHLLKAIPPGMHLLLVGDVDQLPSVGAGSVLKDVIQAIAETRSESLQGHEPDHPLQGAAIVRLDTIFRQAAGSYIIENAHRINRGRMPTLDNDSALDFFLFRTDDQERAAELCVELVQERIPRKFAIPPQDIQVLTPMHRGMIGVGALNAAIQSAVNPSRDGVNERQIGSQTHREGDRVMQLRNNYDKDVYNGDMGVVQTIDPVDQEMVVSFDGRLVRYSFLELDELVLAYAISIHKSQGSEFPAVVIPMMTTHYMMLQRNLLYTAVTRAKRLVVLVGQPRAIAIATRNNNVSRRYTGLTERLLNLHKMPGLEQFEKDFGNLQLFNEDLIS